VLSRPRLLSLLPASDTRGVDDATVTLLCGPAGCGKTTLLSEWARGAGSERPIAWLSLAAVDNDVFLLWSAILRALEQSGAWPEDSALHRLAAPHRTVDAEFLTAFAAAFDDLQRPGVVLVLDDLHEVVAREAVTTLHLLLRDCPPGLRVVLSTRFVQLLSVARLRLEGKVREVDAGCFQFTSEEAADLLHLHDVRLTDVELRQLMVRTEGWAAGLRLAAMWLARASHRGAMIADFVRDDRAVADYLVGEVIDRQEPHVRQFLLATAICDELTPDLARALSGRDDAGALLDQLVRTHALITRTAGECYRYHPMLREYLRAELARQRITAARGLHRRAAEWFEQRGQTLTAIEHAARAEDEYLLSRMLSAYGLSHITNGEGAVLRRLLRGIPSSWSINRNPIVTLVQVAAALDAEDTRTLNALPVPPPADVAEGALNESSDATTHPLFPTVALQRARMSSDSSAARALLAQETFPTGQLDLDLLTALERGVTWLWLGVPDRAGAELGHALSLAVGGRRDWMTVRCLSMLSGAALAAGDFATAQTRASEALATASARGWGLREVCATARLTSGWLAYQRVDDEAAAELATSDLASASDPVDLSPQIEPRLLAALLRSSLSDTSYSVASEIREIWSARWPGHVQPQLAAMALLAEQRLAYAAGVTVWGVEVADRCRKLLGDTAELQVLRAVDQAYRGRTRSARQLLAPVLTGATRSTSVMTDIEAWLWEARLAHRAGERQRADAALAEAIALAAPRGVLRPLLSGGREAAELLSRSSGRFGHSEDFAARARSALRADGPSAGALLTTRELELLTELPSMRTAEEIAASLYVSVNTVKTHMRGIYRKLGVSNRRQAVVLARRRGLL
jgi:LuxR family transcriptional regulator, maltose regulon positive regulatory protein